MRKISSRKVMSYVIIFIIFIFAYNYISKNINLIEKFNEISTSGALYISIAIIFVLLLNGRRTKVLTEIFTEKPIKFTEWFGLSIINTVGNYSPFQGGFIARGYYLKNYYNVPYSKFLSSILASTVVTFSTFSTLSIITLLINYFTQGYFPILIFFFFLTISVSGFLLIFYLPKFNKEKLKGKVGKYLKSFLEGWELISHGKNIVRKLVVIDILLAMVTSLRFFAASNMIEAGMNIFQSIIIAMTSTAAILVNITPGALGIREAIAGFSAQLLGTQLEAGVLVASVERVLILAWVFGLGIPFIYYFNHKINKK